MNNNKTVSCLTTGETFSSIAEAARVKGVNYFGIINCCNKKQKSSGGLQWAYFIDGEPGFIPQPGGGSSASRKVKCVETGDIFNSIFEAAKITGVTRQAIKQAAERKNRCCGYHWEFVE